MRERSPSSAIAWGVIFTLSVCGIWLLACASKTHASPITVLNFSFEDTSVADNSSTSGIASWTTSGNAGTFDPNNDNFAGTTGDNANTSGTLPNGGQIAYSTNYFGGPLGGSLTQAVGTVAAGTTYTLTVAVGTRLDTISGGWKIELLAGATSIGSVTALSGPAPGTFADYQALAGPLPVGSANVGQILSIKISTFNTAGNSATAQTEFDNVRLDATVPEPATAALVVGILGFVQRSRRGRV